MTFATIGWFVVHALWIGAAIGGAAALALALLPDRRARQRHAIAYAGLMLMVLAPLGATLGTLDLFTPRVRMQATQVIESTVGLPTLVVWRSRVVRGAAAIWLVGLTGAAVRVAREWRRIRPVLRSDADDVAPALRKVVSSLASELRVRTPVAIRRSARAEVPMVFGWRRSTILLPSYATRELQPSQLRGVIAHELAHVRRGDCLANGVQIIADTILWFHPAARWLSRQIRAEREYCCDDEAVRVGVEPVEYARALARLEDARHDCRLAVAAASGTLLDRIERVVGRHRRVLTPARGTVALVTATAAALAIAALAMVVPPGMPLDARLRSRSPAPAAGVPPPSGVSLPRVPGPVNPLEAPRAR